MGAADLLLHELGEAGIRVLADGDHLIVTPASALTDGVRQRIRASKTELLARLSAAPHRSYKLSQADADAAHAEPWSDAAIARFVARVAGIRRRGFSEPDAEDLAERMHLLDVQAEGRVICLGCTHLAGSTTTGWRCGNHRQAGMPRELAADLVTLAQRCHGFREAT